jgi:hypothetical protein
MNVCTSEMTKTYRGLYLRPFKQIRGHEEERDGERNYHTFSFSELGGSMTTQRI